MTITDTFKQALADASIAVKAIETPAVRAAAAAEYAQLYDEARRDMESVVAALQVPPPA